VLAHINDAVPLHVEALALRTASAAQYYICLASKSQFPALPIHRRIQRVPKRQSLACPTFQNSHLLRRSGQSLRWLRRFNCPANKVPDPPMRVSARGRIALPKPRLIVTRPTKPSRPICLHATAMTTQHGTLPSNYVTVDALNCPIVYICILSCQMEIRILCALRTSVRICGIARSLGNMRCGGLRICYLKCRVGISAPATKLNLPSLHIW
jgi:hypothetical protein